MKKYPEKKLNYDADVEIGKEYYLLRRGYFYYHNHSSIQIEKAVEKRFGWESWTLYEVKALEFNEESARFFLDFHCRLTAEPVTLQPVWPLYIKAPSEYYPIVCAGRSQEDILKMEEENALPHGWENMDYETFLAERRKLMAQKIKAAVEQLKKSIVI